MGQQAESYEGTQAASSSEFSFETNIEMNMINIESSSEQLINTTNSQEDGNTSTCSIDSDDFSPTGTQDNFVKIAVDFWHYEKHVFVRGLVQDGRMVEIEIGNKPDTLKVFTKNSSNQADYDGLRQFMQRGEHYCSGGQNYVWGETIELMLTLWREYLKANGEIT